MTEPLWTTGTPAQAIDVLVAARAKIEPLLAELTDSQLKKRSVLGGGEWSVKDLIGHLTSWEELALVVGADRERPDYMKPFTSADERNAAEVGRKLPWSIAKVRKESATIRSDLLSAIEAMDDATWRAKIAVSDGKKSARGLAMGKILVGGKFGLWAHDLAHLKDLEASVAAL